MGLTGRVVARQALLDVPFGTVLVEEVAFRGVVLGLLLAPLGHGWALVVSSLLFGIWHVPSALELHEAQSAGPAGPWARRRTVLATVAFTALAGVGVRGAAPADREPAATRRAALVGQRVRDRRGLVGGASRT